MNEQNISQYEVDESELLQEALGSGAWKMFFDENGELTSVVWSQVFRHMIGYKDTSDFPDSLNNFFDLLHEDDRDRIIKHYWNAVKDYTNRSPYDEKYRLYTKNRGFRWFHAAGRVARRDDGSPISFVGYFIDIDDQVKADEKLKKAHEANLEQLHVLQSLGNVYYSMHLINLETGKITEYSSNDLLRPFFRNDLPVHLIMHNIMDQSVTTKYRAAALEFTNLKTIKKRMQGLKSLSSEFVGIHTGWFIANFITVDADKEGYPVSVLFTTQIIEESKKKEETLFIRSLTDEMTGFLNRRAYEEQLKFYRINPIDDNLVFISFDINRLKYVNDTFGHAAGDELIVGFSCILNNLKDKFGFKGKVYRIGGDEFIAMALIKPEQFLELEKIFYILVDEWHGELVDKISISCGASFRSECPDSTIDEMAKQADMLMYKAKTIFYHTEGLDRRE